MNDLLVTTSEAASILGISDAGVRMLVMRGDLRPLDRSARPMHFWEREVVDLEHARRPKSRRVEVSRLAREWRLAVG